MTKDLVILNGKGIPTTTSLKVAEVFGKRHDTVLRKIKTLDCSADFNARNFAAVDYRDGKGEKRPMFEMTRDGWSFLVMGFTGKKAAQFKERFIEAFNRMEAALRAKFDPSRLSRMDILQIAIDAESERLKLEHKVIELKPKAKKFEQLMDCRGVLNLRESAKALGVGPNNMTKALRKVGAFFKNGQNNNCPKQKLIDDGYFVVKTLPKRHDPFSFASQTFVTAKGLGWLSDAIEKGLMSVTTGKAA